MGLKRMINDTEVGLVVSHLPNRQKPILLAVLGNSGRVIASFKSEEDAKIFDKALELLVLGKGVDADEKNNTNM